MSKIFLTGGTGVIGRETVHNLITSGHSVSLLTRNRKVIPYFDKLGVSCIEGDLFQQGRYKRELQDSDVVIHLAAEIRLGNLTKEQEKMLLRTNIEGTYRVFKSFKESSCKQLIFTSTRQIYGPTYGVGSEKSPHNGINQSLYVKSKYYGHLLALNMIEIGSPITILIPGTVYSQNMSVNGINKFFRLFYSGKLKVSTCSRSFNTYVDSQDAAKGIIQAIHCKNALGEEIIIANGFTTYEQLLSLCQRITGKIYPRIKIPLFLAKFGAKIIAGKNVYLNKENLNNLQNSCKLSNEKSKKILHMKYKPLLPSLYDAFRYQYLKLEKSEIQAEIKTQNTDHLSRSIMKEQSYT